MLVRWVWLVTLTPLSLIFCTLVGARLCMGGSEGVVASTQLCVLEQGKSLNRIYSGATEANVNSMRLK